MDESSRPSKKRRASTSYNVATTPPSVNGAASLAKSTDFWIDDGNVVLRTADKQYRIHRGVLSMHSSVFRDMFAIPQPAEQQTLDNVPIIDVTDSAEDWDLLFPVIYGIKSMYVPGTTVIGVPLMIAMLRLGRKYDLERLKREALQQLESFFPDSLAKWDHLFENSGEDLQDIMGDHIMQLVHIALELNLQRVLPFGYFTCVREVNMAKILGGTDKPSEPMLIPRETQNRLVLGKEALIRAASTYSMVWFFDGVTSGTCLVPEDCRGAIQAVLKQQAQDPIASVALDPPVYTRHFAGLCSDCAKEAETKNLAGRQQVFRMLPIIFGLDLWDQLKNDI